MFSWLIVGLHFVEGPLIFRSNYIWFLPIRTIDQTVFERLFLTSCIIYRNEDPWNFLWKITLFIDFFIISSFGPILSFPFWSRVILLIGEHVLFWNKILTLLLSKVRRLIYWLLPISAHLRELAPPWYCNPLCLLYSNFLANK